MSDQKSEFYKIVSDLYGRVEELESRVEELELESKVKARIEEGAPIGVAPFDEENKPGAVFHIKDGSISQNQIRRGNTIRDGKLVAWCDVEEAEEESKDDQFKYPGVQPEDINIAWSSPHIVHMISSGEICKQLVGDAKMVLEVIMELPDGNEKDHEITRYWTVYKALARYMLEENLKRMCGLSHQCGSTTLL